MHKNYMKMQLPSLQCNREVISSMVSVFAEQLKPTVEELNEICTIVYEAVDNCVNFAYPDDTGLIYVTCKILNNNVLNIIIKDKGVGIVDIEKAMQPLFSTGGSMRCGLGLTVIDAYATKCSVMSVPGKGTTVNIKKQINQ